MATAAAGAVYGFGGFGGSAAAASVGASRRHPRPRLEVGPSTSSSTSGSAACSGSCRTHPQRSSIPVTGSLQQQLERSRQSQSQLQLQRRRRLHLQAASPPVVVVASSSSRWPSPPQEQQQQRQQHLRTAKVQNWTTTTRTTITREKWRVGAGAKGSKVADVGVSDFDAEVLQSSVPVLVEFWATWCGPCKLMSISLDWAAQEYEGKLKCVKIESDPNSQLVEKYHVYGLPTVILFVNGEAVPNTKKEGAINKGKLQEYLEASLPALAPAS